MQEDKEQVLGQMCDDNRFELIEKYKQKLIKATNIETAKDEMKVLDNVLFRFWQMGWLDILEEKEIAKKRIRKRVRRWKNNCLRSRNVNISLKKEMV